MTAIRPGRQQTMEGGESHRSSPLGEQRVGVLQGDRLCTACHYNLTGQSIVRESQYDLLIVRCPECGTVASVQEYPLLGRWSSRWAGLTAALFLLFAAALFAATVLTIFGLSIGAAGQSTWRLRQALDQQFQAWQAQQMAAQNQASPPSWQAWQQQFDSWWASQNLEQQLDELGGWFGAAGWQAFVLWVPLGLAAVVFGAAWAVVLLHLKRRGHLVFGAVVAIAVVGLAGLVLLEWASEVGYGSWSIAQRVMGPRMVVMSITLAMVMFVVGLTIGRPAARGLVRAMVPPRLRGALAILWIADGLPPPTARR